MGLVRTWSRQVARAAGASLIAPIVLLVAAGVVASGGGLGGLGSLGQVAFGPPLPDTGLATVSSSSIEAAEIVGADVAVASRTASAAPPATVIASVSAPPASARPERERLSLDTQPRPPAQPPVRRSPLTDTGDSAPVEAPGAGSTPGSGPLAELDETIDGLEESLSGPLPPDPNQLLDLLLPFASPRR